MIEVSVNGIEQRRIQSHLRDIYYRSLLPVIDKVCSELSTPEQLHRIDRVEIELGELSPDNIDAILTQSFAAAFKKQLAGAIRKIPEADANLELFDFFIRCGSLPWWVDSGEANPLSTRLDTLVRDNPQGLRLLLRNIPESSRAWRRIVRAYPDALLDKLVGVLLNEVWTGDAAAKDPGSGASWLILLRNAGVAGKQSTVTLNRVFWEQVLRTASAYGSTPVVVSASNPSIADFYRVIFKQIAGKVGQDYSALVVSLQRAVNTATVKINPWVKQVIASLDQTQKNDAPDHLTKVLNHLSNLLLQLEKDGEPTASSWIERLQQLRQAVKQLPASPGKSEWLALMDDIYNVVANGSDRDRLITLIRATLSRYENKKTDKKAETNRQISSTDSRFSEVLNHLSDLLLQLEKNGELTASSWVERLQQLRQAVKQLPASRSKSEWLALIDNIYNVVANGSARDRLITLIRATLSRYENKKIDKKAETNRQVPSTDSRFSEADALYINNAGLVILWPFLSRFFQHLQLLTDDKQFIDETARQRAVGLLQYLANGDESPQEFLLSLNKILCGMAPEDVFDFDAEINAEEKQACEDLLTAVIQQAPVLKNISIDGFRGSFLLRRGQLSVIDDHWLLRVERETHDIVLDHFPWTFSIVKLPWMKAMMQVDW